MNLNFFETKNTAERYERGRPYFHSNTIRKVQEYLKLSSNVGKALDIACGTGLSTKALLEIAEQVYGTDISTEMLKKAYQHQNIKYKLSTAEQQPFDDNYFDLITVSSGVHWFDIDKFLYESNRILKTKSRLILYENHFISEMQGVDEFSLWFPEMYCKKFPSPPRNNNYEWTNENLMKHNFAFEHEQKFKNEVEFTIDKLILYFTTQSNITAQIESKMTSYEEVENWLLKELRPFFTTRTRKINYGNWIKYLQKTN